ncbi:hypothetical protein [Pararhizobium haloflavum]|uniref:hypothetical protein n=1 Tax=Pararhizobium haloflavum TaxID=2037914 RepID=UPI000C17730B|nr:hypothetical protein [Pararhizobium haloflavum]
MSEVDQTQAEELLKAAKKLIAAVDYDVNGIRGKGGNGGLTSTDTIRAADEARLAIYRYERKKNEE